MFELDDNGFITSWSNGAELIFGYDEAEVLGMHVSILFAPGELQNHIAVDLLHRTETVGSHVAFVWHKHKSGKEFWAYNEGHLLGAAEKWGFCRSASEWTVGQSVAYR